MDALAGDLLAADLIAALASEGLAVDIRNIFDGRRSCHQLKDGAGDIFGIQEAIDIDAVVLACRIPRHVRDIVRIIRWGGHAAQDLAGLVVIDADRPSTACQQLQRLRLHIGVNGHCHPACPGLGAADAGDAAVADHPAGVVVQQR